MADQIKTKPKRRYDSSRRQARARETQREIIEAARRLFMERGYSGTTIEQIAQEAGVAVETLYSTFGSKRAVLSRLVGVSVVGDDEPVRLLERPGPQAVQREPDQHRQVGIFAHDMREIMDRVGPVFGIMRTAAETEPDIAVLLSGILQNRLQGITQFVRWLAANAPLRDGLTLEDAAETTWTLTSAEVHHLLTVDRGWSGDRYEAWLKGILMRLLLD
ncbi:MAG: helix-turn-helix domain-containing protein [Chloroflexota bacterium]